MCLQKLSWQMSSPKCHMLINIQNCFPSWEFRVLPPLHLRGSVSGLTQGPQWNDCNSLATHIVNISYVLLELVIHRIKTLYHHHHFHLMRIISHYLFVCVNVYSLSFITVHIHIMLKKIIIIIIKNLKKKSYYWKHKTNNSL